MQPSHPQRPPCSIEQRMSCMGFRVIQWATVGQGAVVNISSRLASMTQTMFVAYGSAKAALPRMTRNIAPELAPRVRVNAIDVGSGATPSLESVLIDDDLRRQFVDGTPMGRPGEPRTSHVPCCTWCPTRHPGSRARCSRSMAAPRLVRCRSHRPSSNPGDQEVPECEPPPYSSVMLARLCSLRANGAVAPWDMRQPS